MRVLNHAGVCMSYEATWQHIQQLIFEAGYADVVKQGSWIWIYDNLNLMRKVRHERSGMWLGSHAHILLFRQHSIRTHQTHTQRCSVLLADWQ